MYCVQCGTKLLPAQTEQGRLLCHSCGHITYENPAPCISALIVSEDRILLGLRGKTRIMPGKWCLPCGHIEKNESFLDAARREVYEETHLNIQPLSILNVVTNHFHPDTHSLVIVLLAEPTSWDLQAGDDLSQVDWFPLDGPLPALAFQADRHIIEQYRRHRTSFGISLSDTESVFFEP